MTPRPVTYGYDKTTGNILLPVGPPFDGQPVLIKISAGWCEAWWDNGKDSYQDHEGQWHKEGWQWVCMDDEMQADLDDAKFWMPLPSTDLEYLTAPEVLDAMDEYLHDHPNTRVPNIGAHMRKSYEETGVIPLAVMKSLGLNKIEQTLYSRKIRDETVVEPVEP